MGPVIDHFDDNFVDLRQKIPSLVSKNIALSKAYNILVKNIF